MASCITDFFLTANTPQGLVSHFDLLHRLDSDWRCYLLEGVAGNGKSTLLWRIAHTACEKYEHVERIHCSGNPHSLDGVIVWDAKLLFLDATAPHLVSPLLPQISHCMVSLYHTVDADLLWDQRPLIYPLQQKYNAAQENALHALASAACLYQDTLLVSQRATDLEKVAAQANRICTKEFRHTKVGTGKEHYRFLSAMTSQGNICFSNTVQALADRVYLLEDEYGASSRMLIHAVRTRAIACGYDVIRCCCAIRPQDEPEHLFIPELGIAFVTSNRFHNMGITPYRIINSRRFTDAATMKLHRKHLSFNKRISAQLLEQSLQFLGEAAALHQEIEAIYHSAVDFSAVDQVGEDLCKRL